MRALLALLVLLGAAQAAEDPAPGARHALLLEVKDTIGPAVSDFVVRGIERAERDGAELVILRMDTPGGLDTSMREIIQKILASAVPVATYVAPGGSRAASAGTYILLASHVAAMAPATNLGAATPVSIGGGFPGAPSPEDGKSPSKKKPADAQTGEGDDAGDQAEGADEPESPAPTTAMERKVVNDAVAYIRGLARLHGRNADWAERAVREAESLNAADALEQGVVDLVASDVEDLLEQLDGRELEVLGNPRTLDTAELDVRTLEPDWRSKLLSVITNPNVAYILMLLGVYGLFFELSNPGNIVPGVIGAICLLLALYAFQVLPVSYAGLALILVGIAFMVGEAFMPSFGALGIGGAVAFVVGSLILMDTEVEGYTLSLPLVLGVAATSAVFFMGVVTIALKLRGRPARTGAEQMVGSVGEAAQAFDATGPVLIHGETWEARTRAPVARGQRVRVRALDGLTLEIDPETEER